MKACEPCGKEWDTWFQFVRHLERVHGINAEHAWLRATQIGDQPCVAVRTDRGDMFLMVQGLLL